MSDRTIHTGQCRDCLASFAVWPSWEADADLPETDQWDDPFPDCYVCDGRVDFDWADPMTSVIRTGYRERTEP